MCWVDNTAKRKIFRLKYLPMVGVFWETSTVDANLFQGRVFWRPTFYTNDRRKIYNMSCFSFQCCTFSFVCGGNLNKKTLNRTFIILSYTNGIKKSTM